MPGSDADVLVLVDRSTQRFVDRPVDLLPLFDDVGVSVDLFCYTPEEARKTPFAQRALAEGLLLAERNEPRTDRRDAPG